jgi:regulator of protease activity HflC (stomatin/prohibitin superfamily)
MRENELKLASGWSILGIAIATPFVVAALAMTLNVFGIVIAIILAIAWFICMFGFVIVNPNEAKVAQLFGRYVGTIKETGFFWGNPFYLKSKVSLRVQTFETGGTDTPTEGSPRRKAAKVNDRDGTPIEIGAVVVFRVTETAAATFAVDNYVNYMHMQADAALRSLASQYSYDSPDDQAHSLRGHTGEVAERLKNEIQERVHTAGLEVVEARISCLSYAAEIAGAMLQRQQATAIIAARQRIVEGAVGMVEHALEMIAAKNVIQLDDERKAAMVSNLLVVLCGHGNPQPVINTGSIYQ